MDVEIKVLLTNGEAEALAQFVKRVGWQEFRHNAAEDKQAYLIRAAIDQVVAALRQAGYAPRTDRAA